MLTHTHYLWFETKKRQEIIDITEEVEAQVRASGVREGSSWSRPCTSAPRSS